MTYQLPSLHPTMPARPARTSEREPARHPPARIFSERPFCRVVQQISTTNDRIHCRRLLDGKPVVSFRFAVSDLGLLERAIEFSKTEERVRNAGRIRLPFDDSPSTRIEVGGGRGLICLRVVVHGEPKNDMRLEGAEINALFEAIAHFKMTAAHAALKEETHHV